MIQNYLLREIPSTTSLIISNDESFARNSDYVIYMENGKIIKQGKPSEIL